jgi:hypothetical protein
MILQFVKDAQEKIKMTLHIRDLSYEKEYDVEYLQDSFGIKAFCNMVKEGMLFRVSCGRYMRC